MGYLADIGIGIGIGITGLSNLYAQSPVRLSQTLRVYHIQFVLNRSIFIKLISIRIEHRNKLEAGFKIDIELLQNDSSNSCLVLHAPHFCETNWGKNERENMKERTSGEWLTTRCPVHK